MIDKFSNIILEWYVDQKRDLPWRFTKDPYKIWLSEIIMQQTQIVQGTSYYLKFIERFPTINDLAAVDEQDVLLLWQGLGYYSRARNLHKTAKYIVSNFQGIFPQTYEELIKLKGVGDYTASAIASICFNKPTPSIDGNVLRFIARLFDIREPVNKKSGKKKIKHIAESLISKDYPGDFNQALMDFGSMQCKSSRPKCLSCIFKNSCLSYQNGTVSIIPVKERNLRKVIEYYYYFIVSDKTNETILIRKRENGIWKNLYEFPKVTSELPLSDQEVLKAYNKLFKLKRDIVTVKSSIEFKHVLTHKTLIINFLRLQLNSIDKNKMIKCENFINVKSKDLTKYPYPVIIKKYIEQELFEN